MNLSNFHRDYLTLQGVILLPSRRVISKQFEQKEKEAVPMVPMYERD
jgi:hypothetical protein